MEPQIIGIKQLHKELSQVAQAASGGRSFVVLKHAHPLFRIVPLEYPTGQQPKKKFQLADLLNLRFEARDKNLSKKIDEIVYGV